MLLMPGTPMLFQGQEFSSSSPFLYFADFDEALNAAVKTGRGEFLRQFPSAVGYALSRAFDAPGDVETFERSKLNFAERGTHAEVYALHRDLLALRREHAAFRAQRLHGVDGAVLGPHAFVLRFFEPPDDDRLLIVNLGADLVRCSFAEPLLAPMSVDNQWEVRWSSEDPRYGGGGTPDICPEGRWHLPADTALVLSPGHSSRVPRTGVRRRTA
jgi:maltooligosyltrehalose trehalohydrolase